MEENRDFTSELEEALAQKREEFERTILSDLKEQFRSFYSSFQSIYNVLLRKSLIKEDPYKYDKKTSEVTVPSQSPFLESERHDQVSIRLSDLDNQLDFLTSYYQFDLEYLTLKRIKTLAGLTKYIKWDQLSENSTNMMTRSVAEMVGKIKKGSDNFSTQLISDSQNQLSSITMKIMSHLKLLTFFHREHYKLQIRRNVLSDMNLSAAAVQNKENEVMKLIKKKFATAMGDQPFYAELIQEVLAEDYGPDSDTLQNELLQKLFVKKEKKKKVKQGPDYKEMLLESVRTLASASIHIEEAVRKLSESNLILFNRTISFGEKVKQWLSSFGGKKDDKQIYEIEYFDTKTSVSKTERLDFNQFCEEAAKRAKVLANLSSKMTPAYQRIAESSEDQIFKFLNKNIEELQIMLKRLPALDTYFKTEIPKEQRGRIRGIKIEVNAIKNAVVKANKKKHEYVSKKEEEQQLKRLGIRTDAQE